MKASCTFVASVLAASTAALAAPSCDNDSNLNLSSNEGQTYHRYSPSGEHGMADLRKSSSSSNLEKLSNGEKFAPRFDGLRFIETLITAHR
nr:hypothetical protein DM860_007145 [Ipomoea batatas]GMD25456.1 hypothetical protein DM860_007145 [Ipomoea batatas]